MSAVLVPDGIDSAAVVRRAHQAYNTSLGVGLSKVAGKVFRIGHLGWLNDVMVCGALSAGAAIEQFRLSERPVIAKAA